MKTEMLTVKRELPAMRCEICHQTDCFTPETGVCTRCSGVTAQPNGAEILVEYLRREILVTNERIFDRSTILYLASLSPLVGGVVFGAIAGAGWALFGATVTGALGSLGGGTALLLQPKKAGQRDWVALSMTVLGGHLLLLAVMIAIALYPEF